MGERHPSYAFVIDGEGKRVIFTGDLHGDDPVDFPKIAMEEPSDAIICELAHFSIGKVLPYLEKCDTKKVLFNHYNNTWSLDDLREITTNNPLSYPVEVLHDGDRIKV